MSLQWRPGKRIAIIGGGPGGVSTALAFHKKGYDVRVYELQPEPKAIGGAVLLSSPVLAILRSYGVDISKFGEYTVTQFRNHKGRVRVEMPFNKKVEDQLGIKGWHYGVLRSSAFAEMFLDEKGRIRNRSNHEGALSMGVPGTVAGLFKAHQKLGRLPWNSLLEPAVRLARQGFPLTWSLHDDFRRMKNWWKRYPSSAEVFLKPNGDAYEPGENWRQPYLATTLQRIQREGAKGFYQGETARLIAQFMKDNNGLIRLNDLSSYRAIE
ncbi:MAG: hypothetical protein COB84_10075, partial [Rhodobacteraceae bacterium]